MDMENKHDNAQLALRLCNGKFMRGNVEVAAEIGNREQIDLLRHEELKAEERERQSKKGNLEAFIKIEDICFTIICEFTCVCGYHIKEKDFGGTAIWPDEIEDAEWEDGPITCPRCGRVYETDGINAKLIGGPDESLVRRIGLQNQTK